MKAIGLAVAALSLCACTDAKRAAIGALGSAGTVRCYSGGTLIYEGRSTGKIHSEDQSDGYLLVDAKTGKLVRVSGDCVVEN